MRSIAEIVDAFKRCNSFENRCKGCTYEKYTNEECIHKLFNDIILILDKSDFEVMKEILERSEEYHNDYSYEIQGNDYPTIILHRGTQMLWVDFDDKGNIL